MKKLLISYLLTTLAFFALDLLWLGAIAKNLYQKYLNGFLSDHIKWPAAIIFYLIFIAGIYIFAIYPAVQKNSMQHALVFGGLFGLFTYATYELTNYAVLKNWPLNIVIIDILWGTVLTALVSLIGFYIMNIFKYFN